MKKFDFKLNENTIVVVYGTIEELREEALNLKVSLPQMSTTDVCIDYAEEGLVIFAVESGDKIGNKIRDVERIKVNLLQRIFKEVGGEELPEDELDNIAKDFFVATELIELEIKEIGT